MKQVQLFFAVADPARISPVAVIKIVRLAHALNARVVLFHVLKAPRVQLGSALGLAATTLKNQCRRSLLATANRLQAHGIRTSIQVSLARSIDEALLIELKSRPDRLLILGGTRGWRPAAAWLNRRLFRMIDLSPCNVLVIRSPEPYPLEPRIVASVGSRWPSRETEALDDLVVGTAQKAAMLLDGQLHVYHAIPPLASMLAASHELRVAPTSIREEVYAAGQEDAEDGMRRLAARHSLSPARIHIEELDIRTALPQFSTRHAADITFVGAPFRLWKARRAADSTWTEFLGAMKSDVLLVKPAACKVSYVAPIRNASLESTFS